MSYGFKLFRSDGNILIDDTLKVYQSVYVGTDGYISSPKTIPIKSFALPLLAVRGGVGKIISRTHNGSYYDSVTIIGRPDPYAGFSTFEWAVLCTGGEYDSGFGLRVFTEDGQVAYTSQHGSLKIEKSVELSDVYGLQRMANRQEVLKWTTEDNLPKKWDMWYGNDSFSYPGYAGKTDPEIPQNLKVKEPAHSSTAWALIDGVYAAAQANQGQLYGYIGKDKPLAGISNGNFILLTHSYYFRTFPTPYDHIQYVPPSKPAVGIGYYTWYYPWRIYVTGTITSIDL